MLPPPLPKEIQAPKPEGPKPKKGSFARGNRPPRMRRRHDRRGERCLNCDAAIEKSTHYCPHCGQENINVNVSILYIFREAADEYIRLDSKFVRTFIPLMFQPGRLTREWSQGRRTKYVSPLKLYLTITFLFFLALPFVQGHVLGSDISTVTYSPATDDEKVDSSALPGAPKADAPKPDSHKTEKLGAFDRVANDLAAKSLKLKPNQTAGQSEKKTFHVFGFAPLDNMIALSNDPTGNNRRLFGQQFASHLPTAIFLMLPVFAVFVWILYVRNARYYVEHLVFALHCHSFYFVILFITAAVARTTIGADVFMPILLLTIPIYSIVALKLNYGQGWFKTLIKSIMLGFAYSILLGCAMLAAVFLAAINLPAPT